jgi:uncharacterized RDD family membrane protein YckC
MIISATFLLLSFLNETGDSDRDEWMLLFISGTLSFYHLLSELALNGRSAGKIAVGLRVIRANGERPTFWHYLLRWVFRPLEIIATMGSLAFLSIAFSRRSQRIGDLAAGTIVIRERRKEPLPHLQEFDTPDNHEVRFPQVALLNDRDIVIIKEVLEKVKQEDIDDLLPPLVERVKSVTGIASDLPPLEFTETILRDYTHLTKR